MSVRSPLPTRRCANIAQFCVACKRLYVHEDIYDDLARELVEVAKMVMVGNDLEGAEMGPIQNRMRYDKVRDLLDDCRDTGQTFLLGGEVSGETAVGIFECRNPFLYRMCEAGLPGYAFLTKG